MEKLSFSIVGATPIVDTKLREISLGTKGYIHPGALVFVTIPGQSLNPEGTVTVNAYLSYNAIYTSIANEEFLIPICYTKEGIKIDLSGSRTAFGRYESFSRFLEENHDDADNWLGPIQIQVEPNAVKSDLFDLTDEDLEDLKDEARDRDDYEKLKIIETILKDRQNNPLNSD